MKKAYERKLEYKSIINKYLGLIQNYCANIKRCTKSQRWVFCVWYIS